MRSLFVMLAACKAAPSLPPPVIANYARPAPLGCKLTGKVIEATTGEPLVGATLVLTSPQVPGENVQIVDENGRFAYDLNGRDHLTIYYADTVVQRPVHCGDLPLAVWLRPVR